MGNGNAHRIQAAVLCLALVVAIAMGGVSRTAEANRAAPNASLDAQVPGVLTNLSTRGRVGTGDDVMIVGFIVAERDTQVIVRAIGPDLGNRGVKGALEDPTLRVYRDQEIIAENDNWVDSPNRSQIEAAGLAPVSPLESAVLLTLQPGAYTTIVSGSRSRTGVALAEVFRMDAVEPLPTAVPPPTQVPRPQSEASRTFYEACAKAGHGPLRIDIPNSSFEEDSGWRVWYWVSRDGETVIYYTNQTDTVAHTGRKSAYFDGIGYRRDGFSDTDALHMHSRPLGLARSPEWIRKIIAYKINVRLWPERVTDTGNNDRFLMRLMDCTTNTGEQCDGSTSLAWSYDRIDLSKYASNQWHYIEAAATTSGEATFGSIELKLDLGFSGAGTRVYVDDIEMEVCGPDRPRFGPLEGVDAPGHDAFGGQGDRYLGPLRLVPAAWLDGSR